jgi:flagellar FliL protein
LSTSWPLIVHLLHDEGGEIQRFDLLGLATHLAHDGADGVEAAGAQRLLAFGGQHDANAKEAKKDERPKLPPRYINLDPPFVVNFEAQSSVRFLQVSVGVMTREPEIEALIKDNDPRVRNDMLMILSNQTYESVSTADGKEALRTRCLDAIRTIVREMGGKPERVEALYFTSFVMQ